MKESKICQALYQTGNLLPVDSGQKSMSFANVDGLMEVQFALIYLHLHDFCRLATYP